MATLSTKKQEIFDYVNNMLGGGMVDVELDPAHYETAITKALTRFRQRSDNSVEEAYDQDQAVVMAVLYLNLSI